jgi:hypothetical protein
MYAGAKIIKINSDGLRNGRRRLTTFKSIRNGMTYEAYVDGGGPVNDLKALIASGNVSVEYPGDKKK